MKVIHLVYYGYVFEKFLYRVSLSKYYPNLILKGGLLLQSVNLDIRQTTDIDLLIIKLASNPTLQTIWVSGRISVVRFDGTCMDISISIVFHQHHHIFAVYFSKKGEPYYPKDYNFVSHYWEGLLLDIEGEMRVPEFNNFLGIGNWSSILRMIEITAGPIFQKFG